MDTLFYCAILGLAFLYASVGHGGASGYLALMALYGLSPVTMKPTALLLNVMVSIISFVAFYRGGHFNRKLILPLTLSSVPMSFLGALQPVDNHWYKIILGICLLFAVLRMVYNPKEEFSAVRPLPWGIAAAMGAVLGYVSGLIGIGGGIMLSPLLVLFRWANTKVAATTSALFIFANSVAGLAGHTFGQTQFTPGMLYMLLFALLGGTAGSLAGSFRWNQKHLKYALASVLLLASIKLFTV